MKWKYGDEERGNGEDGRKIFKMGVRSREDNTGVYGERGVAKSEVVGEGKQEGMGI